MTNATSAIPATVTIVDLPAGSSVVGTELFEAVQTSGGVGNSVKLTLAQMMATAVGALPSGGGTGQFLQATGTSFGASWANIASNVTASTGISVAGSTTIQVALATAAGLSVLGVTGASQTNPAPIAGTGAQVLRLNDGGTVLGFGAVNLGSAAAVSGVLPGANYSAANLAAGGAGGVQGILPGANVTAANLAATGAGGIQGTLAITHGGTNTTTLTVFGAVYGGTTTVGVTSPGNVNTYLAGNNATTAPTFTAFPTVNVVAYGADPTGAAFSDNAIASAIAALPVSGGDVIFPAGTYKITQTISIGAGGGSTISPTSGVRLIGVGLSALPYAGHTTVPAVAINWGTTGTSTMLVVQGPLQGWGIQNIAFKGNGTANIGIQGISCEWGDVKNVSVSGCKQIGIQLTCWSTIAAGLTEANSMHNRFDNIDISIATVNSAQGISLTGNAAITANSCYNKFSNVVLNLPTAGASTGIAGLYLASCDSNKIDDLHILGGTTGQVGIQLDYSVGSTFPSNNFFYDLDPAGNGFHTQFFQTNSPAVNAAPNTIYGLVTANGGADPTLTGLTVYGPKDIQVAGLIQVGSKTAFVAGGTTTLGVRMSSAAAFGIFCGTGVPTISSGTGSLYMRSDATTVAQRLYVNINGTGTWANFTTSA